MAIDPAKVEMAIARVKEASRMSQYYMRKPLVVCVSGGKDSTALEDICIRAGVPLIFWHNHTGMDAPETVHFIDEDFKTLRFLGYECVKRVNPTPFFVKLIQKGGYLPTRWHRWCCREYKEKPIRINGQPVFVALGVRWSESIRRANTRGEFEAQAKSAKNKIVLRDDPAPERRLFEECKLRMEKIVNPIIDWTDDDVWSYIRERQLPYNPLYDMGFKRVGCIGCPMATDRDREQQFEMYSKWKQAYLKAVKRGMAYYKSIGKEEYFHSDEEIINFIETGYSDRHSKKPAGSDSVDD